MTARELIERKKRGESLSTREIAFLVDGFMADRVADYQMAAFLMAVWFRGLDGRETVDLTRCMMQSGEVLDLGDIPGPKVDKHSTGGVGDKVSLPLAGIAAACGLRVPMLSGRGLGHTGGTLDKLESIPGYQTRFDPRTFCRTLAEVGATIVGQSDTLVPADRELYALRDVTATVDCVPLIVASILSKKFAAGVEGVVLDVKVGSGAFMRDLEAARALAGELVRVGGAFEKRIAVLFTRMDEPLGSAVGNAVEVVESVEILKGGGPSDVREVTLALVAEMLCLGGLAPDAAAGEVAARRAVEDGTALERFLAMVRAHGGRLDPDLEDCGLRVSPRADVATAPGDGWLSGVDGYEVGMSVVDLGGGRHRKTDRVDSTVGLRWLVRIGDAVQAGQPLVEVLAPAGSDCRAITRRIGTALSWSDTPVRPQPRILGRVA